MRVLLAAVAASISNIIFQMTVDAGYLRNYGWVIPWGWGLAAALWTAWGLTHDKVAKEWLKSLHDKVGRGIQPIRLLTCILVFFAVSLGFKRIFHIPTSTSLQLQPPFSAPAPTAQQLSAPGQQKQPVKVKGNNNTTGAINQQGNNNIGIVGSGNKVYVNPSKKESPKTPLKTFSAVAANIPFVEGEDGGVGLSRVAIPWDANAGSDPLWRTYNDLAEFGEMRIRHDPVTFRPIPLSRQAEIIFVTRALRYYFLRCILELQLGQSFLNARSGRGTSVVTIPAIPVPDGEVYARDKLEKLLQDTVFGADPTQHHWYWEKMDFKFEVPAGSEITLKGDDSLIVEKPDYFALVLRASSIAVNEGLGALPTNFSPVRLDGAEKYFSFVFQLKMNLEWDGAYEDATPYKEWATALFAGIEKRFKQPSQ